jgi:hypothetical protein
MQKARGYLMGKTTKPAAKPPQASSLLKKTAKVFNEKASAETALIEPKKNEPFRHVLYVKTLNDKFLDAIESKKLWSYVALGATAVFIIAVAYWGIKQ